MVALTKPNWERFAILVAKGVPPTEAYVKAGFILDKKASGKIANPYRLMATPQVKARIQELQKKQAARIGISVEHLCMQLDDMLRLAKRVKHPAAGVGAIMGKAKLLGLVIDKAEVDGTVRRPMREPGEVKQMTLSEWQSKFSPKPVEQGAPPPEPKP